MKILVTGCAGFIGAHLTKKLLEQNNYVTGIDNLNNYYHPSLKKLRLNKLIGQRKNFVFFKEDINKQKLLKNLFERNHFEAVVHLAAQAGVRYSLVNPFCYEKSNLRGLLNILESIKNHSPKTKLIFASSSSVYGNSKNVPFLENDPCDQPLSLYGVTKRAGELMIKTYHHLFGIKACCLRFFTVYGPWGRPDMAYYDFTKRLFNQETIVLYEKDTKRDFTYIDDITEALLKVINKSFSFEIINLGSSKPTSLKNFLEILVKETKKKPLIKFTKLPKTDLKITYANISKAKRFLKWQPRTSLEKGLKEFVNWYKKEKN